MLHRAAADLRDIQQADEVLQHYYHVDDVDFTITVKVAQEALEVGRGRGFTHHKF